MLTSGRQADSTAATTAGKTGSPSTHPWLFTNVPEMPSEVIASTSAVVASAAPHSLQPSWSRRSSSPSSSRSRSAGPEAVSSSWRVLGCSGRLWLTQYDSSSGVPWNEAT